MNLEHDKQFLVNVCSACVRDADSGLRLEPRNVNCHPWSRSLQKGFRLSPIFYVWNKVLEVFVQTFIQILIQPLTMRMMNQVFISFRFLIKIWRERDPRTILMGGFHPAVTLKTKKL